MLSVSDLPTRRNRRCASPQRASFSSVPPPQSRSLPLPLAAVATLPPPGHARISSVSPPCFANLRRWLVTPHSIARPGRLYPYGAHGHPLASGDTSLRRCSALETTPRAPWRV